MVDRVDQRPSTGLRRRRGWWGAPGGGLGWTGLVVVSDGGVGGGGGYLNGMKVYVYDLPSKYNTDWLSNERCSRHLFASEVAIHRALDKSDVRTFDPWDADFFFVPVYVSCNFSKVNGFPAIGHARALMASAVQHISSQLPFWNRSLGSDHIFVASHDFGSCFHTMEDVAIADGVPEILRNSIILQTFGVTHKHPCQDVENVVIPPYVSPESVRATLEKSSLTGRRDIFAFFRGKMEVHPKNVSGRFYSKRVRTEILRRYDGDRRFYLRRHRFSGYQSEIVRSAFCLCPLGWAPWSPRLVESVALGCVPVIIADGIRLPFPAAVPWAEISITVAEADVGRLGQILAHVAATNLTSIQRNLWDPRVRRALLFHDTVLEGDATWQVLEALNEKLDRSHKKSRVSAQ
ncbi:probable glucuronoxylan glucuronosyltransferase irx7 [Phtheirospermum japonicum]|uniref:Probable glucuronoxylan glucuronosyltransferase irx7 n=1 Tax=Phtheirospermum japonicum TaxID=374723 RepID=A0A830B2W9_9LAMI|nr:probable glucuronoxylan glucuronosyltransferase irx7 [Phtheirospermum japonicum]